MRCVYSTDYGWHWWNWGKTYDKEYSEEGFDRSDSPTELHYPA